MFKDVQSDSGEGRVATTPRKRAGERKQELSDLHMVLLPGSPLPCAQCASRSQPQDIRSGDTLNYISENI